MFKQGKFTPKNVNKYKGDLSKIVFRSSWEKLFMVWLDLTDAVLFWSSEEIVIPYLFTVDNKMHRYFPDFYFELQKQDKIEKYLIEIKPMKDIVINKKQKNQQRMLDNAITIERNRCKWLAASSFASVHGLIFKVLTENDLPV